VGDVGIVLKKITTAGVNNVKATIVTIMVNVDGKSLHDVLIGFIDFDIDRNEESEDSVDEQDRVDDDNDGGEPNFIVNGGRSSSSIAAQLL